MDKAALHGWSLTLMAVWPLALGIEAEDKKKERKKSFLLPNEPAAMLDWEKTHASSSWGSNRRVHE